MRIKYFLFGAAALALGACSSDDETENVVRKGKDAYVQVSVKLPSADATRSETGEAGTTDGGTEIGKDYENTISSFQILLVDEDGNIVKSASTTTSGNVPAPGTDTYTTEPVKISGMGTGTKYFAYVIVNGSVGDSTTDLEAAYQSITSTTLTGEGGIADISSKKFLMTGVGDLTDGVTTGNDITAYTKDNPLPLGEVSVERAVARFDYKDYNNNGNVYDLSKAPATGEVVVKLTDIALTNVSPTFYLFRRVSADGTDAQSSGVATWKLGGKEVGGTTPNYVVDYDFANKTYAKWHGATGVDPVHTSFLNPFAPTDAIATGASYTALSSLATATEDSTWNGATSGLDTGGYRIWTYCTENTIQADPTVNQINALTTGVIFKGEISGTMTRFSDDTKAIFADGNKVYVLNGNVIGNWDDVVALKGYTGIATDVLAAKSDVLNAYALGGLEDTEDNNTSAELAEAGFTRYTPNTDGKYITYYYYWNRHNDNGKDNVMGPMEFAVVRDNVYKLSVTEIKRLGHPNDPTKPGGTGDDPDPDGPDPEDPDEDPNLYLKVSVKVVPWTVRKNDIKF